jgi:putative nucleotidyltransferase with HDIG domain
MTSLPSPDQQSPDVQRALEQSRDRQTSRLSPRERAVETLIGGGFAAAALGLILVFGGGAVDWPTAAVAVVALAAASRVVFDVAASYTTPLQLVLVPMLFLVPPATVPLFVALGLALGKLPEVALGRLAPGRVLLSLGDSWCAVGPALVFAIARPGAPDGHDWPVYVAALASQLACDFTAGTVRELLNRGLALGDQLREAAWIYLVDVLLAPVGLAVAFGAVGRPWLVLLILPLAALLMLFARERAARVEHVIELGRAYRGTALVLGNVVEADDEYTGVHCQGVVALSVEVADVLGLDPAERRNVEFAALLHDVGKIAIPKEIINKRGPLDDEEWDVIRTHTIEGQRLLDQVGGFMSEVGAIVRSSHEAFDGSGYPDRLAGEAIRLEARVVACCDAYNAMTTDRPYRRARSSAAAVAELRRCAGTQFDPRVVDAVVRVVEQADGGAALLPDPSALLPQPAP